MKTLSVFRNTTVKTFLYEPPMKVSEALTRFGYSVLMPCGGRGECGKCCLRILGAVSEPDEVELKTLSPEERGANIRLACRAVLLGDAEAFLPKTGTDEIITDGIIPSMDISGESGFGIAADLGTTTLAVQLCSLSDGKVVAEASARNPQEVFGADVISRMDASMHGKKEALCTLIRRELSRLISEVTVSELEVRRAVVTGNTAMLSFFAGTDTASFAVAPFTVGRYFGENMTAEALSLPLAGNTEIYLPRVVSAYVGGDITTAMLACGFHTEENKTVLLADIGTNGEIVLKTGEKLWCCSTAAGPAFEGAGITMGMNAAEGAIYRVDVGNDGVQCRVIGDGKANGICGSGLIDAVAVLRRLGILDETGRLPEEYCFPGTGVILTQKDIRAVQLAKAAICAGIQVLLKKAGITEEEVDVLYLAGGFGSRMRGSSAAEIGLIPKRLSGKTVPVGNAALSGAKAILQSTKMRAESEALSRRAQTLELSTDPDFMDAYIENMLF